MSKYAALATYLRESGQETVIHDLRRHRAGHRRGPAVVGLQAPAVVVKQPFEQYNYSIRGSRRGT